MDNIAGIGYIRRVDEIVTLREAAELLGISPSTLRHQARGGRIRARLIGKTWVSTREEIERYRRANLGRPGRPAPVNPFLVRAYYAFGPVAGRTPAWLISYDQETFVTDPGGGKQAPIAWTGEPVIEAIATREKAAPTEASFDALTREQIEEALHLDLDLAMQVYADFPEPAVVFRAGPIWNAERFRRWQTVAQMRTTGNWAGQHS
jgi:hypothetical protein